MYSHPSRSQTTASKNTSINVALVGVTGVGKSTLVNILVGSDRAEVSNDVQPCTTKPQHYDAEFGKNRFRLWDTRGLNEPRELQEAISPLARLLKIFRRRSGEDQELQAFLGGQDPMINLVLFCIEAKDIWGPSHWKHYGRLYKGFCKKKKVKIVVVVTKLDEEFSRRNWKHTCMENAREVVRGSPNLEGSIEAVPTIHQLRLGGLDMQNCRYNIWRLISSSI